MLWEPWPWPPLTPDPASRPASHPPTPPPALQLREMSPLWELVQEGVDLKSISWVQH